MVHRTPLFGLVCTTVLVALADAEPLTLLFVGDWGGESDAIPTNAAQQADAAGMSTIAAATNAQGVVLLGDNFYYRGVEKNTSVRFQETFEEVYTPAAFLDLPFYVVAGNHDHLGDVQAQIDYHDKSLRWHFPSLFYLLPFNFTSSTGVRRRLDLVMIDTVNLAGACAVDFPGCPLLGPADPVAAEAQWAWLNATLGNSTADHLVVGGHFPVYRPARAIGPVLLSQTRLPLPAFLAS